MHSTARAWLGVLTTILGLLGSVVLFKGGDLVTDVTANGAFRALLIVLISLVFTVAILAVIFGGMTTWGELSSRTPPTVGTGHSWWRKRFFHVAQRLALTSGRQEVVDGKAAWEVYRDDRLESAERRRVLSQRV